MGHLRPVLNAGVREYVGPVALGVAIAVCMPVLAIAVFLLRGVVVAAFGAAIVTIAALALWEGIEPKLSPGTRVVVRDVAMGLALIAGVPLLVIAALVVQGTVVAVLPVAAVTLAIVGLWQLLAAGRHAFRFR